MTPHGVLEDMDKMEHGLRSTQQLGFINEPVWGMAKILLHSAVHFDFSGNPPKLTHAEFAEDLLSRNLFRLPFDTVFFTCQDLEGYAAARLIVPPNDPENWQLWISQITSHDDMAIPIGTFYIGGRGDNAYCRHASLFTDRCFRAAGADAETDEWEASKAAAMLYSFVIGGTAMLMSKDVEIDIQIPSRKLNRRREANGRRLLRERRVVRIKIEHQRSYGQLGGDMRSSPRMHWRRGHFRTLQSGSVVPVAPTIVNASPDTRATPKSYQVSP